MADASTPTTLRGTVQRVTFHNEATGFFVVKVDVPGRRGLTTVVGASPALHPGEHLEAVGQWVIDSQHGQQFKASSCRITPPHTTDGVRKYLASGLIKGIGPSLAKRMVQHFQTDVLEVLDHAPDRLQEIEGVGPIRQARIVSAWQRQKVVRDIMIFLQSHGIGTQRAFRIYKTYGDQAVATIRKNPYLLAQDVRGMGFKSADALAQALGIAPDAPERAEAAVVFVSMAHTQQGHCAIPRTTLLDDAQQLLGLSHTGPVERAIDDALDNGRLVPDDPDNPQHLQPAALYHAEQGIARHVQRLMSTADVLSLHNLDERVALETEGANLQLSPGQHQAITMVFSDPVCVVTGGPGVGKTTLINVLIRLLRYAGVQPTLCAPTGRASKRMTEATGQQATTIHRLLGFDPNGGGFLHHSDNPLKTRYLIVDETSMIDVYLMLAMLKALPDGCRLLLVGDVDQLPSVGPGAVLQDMITSTRVPVTRLTDVFRQAAHSHIIVNAHRINEGKLPAMTRPDEDHTGGRLRDFYWLPCDSQATTCRKALALIQHRIPERFKVDPIEGIQVLTPMQRGGLGAVALNAALQQALNPNPTAWVERFGMRFAVGDKVMQVQNNYDRNVFNGDIGRIQSIHDDDQTVTVSIDGKTVVYDVDDLDELTLAYAITVHKSQGSEYPVVVLPLAMQHFTLLQRNLLYTAVTRGKRLVVLLGDPKAVAMAVRSEPQGRQRLTFLAERLRQVLPERG